MSGWNELENAQKRSRLLYTNPVCLFTTKPSGAPANAMTISWLSPVDNSVRCPSSSRPQLTSLWQGNFVYSMNKRRATASILPLCKRFGFFLPDFPASATFFAVLNVPVRGMEEMVLRIGNTHGNDKMTRLAIPTCSLPGCEEDDELVFIEGCAAHLVCSVVSADESAIEDHVLTVARIERAWVKPEYWSGKCFIPQSPEVPPYLSFLGSQTFAYVSSL